MKIRINEIEYDVVIRPIKGEQEIAIIGYPHPKVYGRTQGNAMDNVILQLTALGHNAKWNE